MAVTSIPGYTMKTGPGGIPIYTRTTPKPKPVPKLTWQPPDRTYTGTMGPGDIPIYTPHAAPAAANPNAAVDAPPRTAERQTGYWNIPDYDALLAGDWEPANAAIRGKELTDTARAQFSKAFRQAFIDWGGDPTKVGEQFRSYLDDPTIEAAKTNKFSAMAQNIAAMTKSLRNQRAQAHARGMGTSGKNVGLTRSALEAREKADYGDLRSFLGGAEQGLTGISEADRQAADLLAEARSRAAARIADTHPQTWEGGPGDELADDGTAAAPEWGGISWGGRSGIKTKAQLQAALGYGQTLAKWAKDHPDAWAKLG